MTAPQMDAASSNKAFDRKTINYENLDTNRRSLRANGGSETRWKEPKKIKMVRTLALTDPSCAARKESAGEAKIAP